MARSTNMSTGTRLEVSGSRVAQGVEVGKEDEMGVKELSCVHR